VSTYWLANWRQALIPLPDWLFELFNQEQLTQAIKGLAKLWAASEG
jgi:hypothetical protein